MSPEELFAQVERPAYYYRGVGGLEAIDVIEAFAPDNYLRGAALKYLLRAGRKKDASAEQDLRKALWFIEREISHLGNPRARPILLKEAPQAGWPRVF